MILLRLEIYSKFSNVLKRFVVFVDFMLAKYSASDLNPSPKCVYVCTHWIILGSGRTIVFLRGT